jgi:hypothetical protein
MYSSDKCDNNSKISTATCHSPHRPSPHACIDLYQSSSPAGVLALHMEHSHVEAKSLHGSPQQQQQQQ